MVAVLKKLQFQLYWIQRFVRRKWSYSYYGTKFYNNWEDQTFLFYIAGVYGSFLSKKLKQEKQPFSFIDIGANQGLYTILAAKNKYCKKVYAIEPVAPIVDILEKNLSLNQCTGNVRVLPWGISDKNTTIQVSFNERHTGKTSITFNQPNAKTTSIRLGNYQLINETFPSENDSYFVKIDVEGHERTVLEELFKSKIGPRIEYIYFECQEGSYELEPIKEILVANNFHEFIQIGEGDQQNIYTTKSPILD
jgi:FkbM family methyltransferase